MERVEGRGSSGEGRGSNGHGARVVADGSRLRRSPETENRSRRLLVLDRDALLTENTPGIEVQPAYEWLLTVADAENP
jgi:hypothetical protein